MKWIERERKRERESLEYCYIVKVNLIESNLREYNISTEGVVYKAPFLSLRILLKYYNIDSRI